MRTVLMCLVMCLILAGSCFAQDANEPVRDVNLVVPGDGLIIGASALESADTPYIKVAYQYGVSQFFSIIEPELDYFEFGSKWESRDIAQPESVPLLSGLLLFITPETAEVTGTAGLSWSYDDINRDINGDPEQGFNVIGGFNIRPNEDKNFLIEVEGVTPIDDDIYFRLMLSWKF